MWPVACDFVRFRYSDLNKNEHKKRLPSCEGGEGVEDGRGRCYLVLESKTGSNTKEQPAASAKATVAKARSLRSPPSFAGGQLWLLFFKDPGD
jgi:hypothetical protein